MEQYQVVFVNNYYSVIPHFYKIQVFFLFVKEQFFWKLHCAPKVQGFLLLWL